MPASAEIVDGLIYIANTWTAFAIGWHLALAALVATWMSGWRPTRRRLGLLLTLPLASVSVFAWLAQNPFNGTLFALCTIALAVVAGRLPEAPAQSAPLPLAFLGTAMLLFGWVYPHFLEGGHTLRYLYAAPTGLIPCPTLSVVIGVALWGGGLNSRSLSLLLAAMGLFYGIFGALKLGVHLDAGLVIGAAAIGVIGLRTRAASAHSVINE